MRVATRLWRIAVLLCAGLSPLQAGAHPFNIAHRGGTTLAPENTLVDYQTGLDNGADWIEIDVWESSDGVLVCHHDEWVDRTTNGTGLVYEHSLAELKALDAGSWFAPEFAGEQIPTLAEALSLVTPQGIAYLDIKRIAYIQPIAALVGSLGIPQQQLVAWIRMGPVMAEEYATHLPESRRVWSMLDWYQTTEAQLWQRAEAGDYGVAPLYTTLTSEFVDLAHSYGLTVHPYKVTSPYFQQVLDTGADGLVVAAPEILSTYLPGPVPQCSDGIDNDGDGMVDYPDEPGCFGPEGPVELTPCSDGIDNDGDGSTDHPDDPGCYGPFSLAEDPECDDGADNDGSGLADFPADPGCFSAFDSREATQCRDGLDNDGDGWIDHPGDDGCEGPDDDSEKPACSDGLDNDGDGKTDFPTDPGCVDADDLLEITDCEDGIDNDGDGLVDSSGDWGCVSADDHSEINDCRDRLDNDADGLVDWPDDPGCATPDSKLEDPLCSDGFDNDGDGNADFPEDLGCQGAWGNDEAPACGDGLDNDLDGVADFPGDPGCTSIYDRSEIADCADGIDNDDDGLFDYPDDPDCSRADSPGESVQAPAMGGQALWILMLLIAILGLRGIARQPWCRRTDS